VPLDDIGLADQPEPVGPERQPANDANTVLGAGGVAVGPLVGAVAAQGEDVLVVGLLEVDQRALPGAVAPVLEGGDEDEVIIALGWYD
jgi:hypothetical protein